MKIRAILAIMIASLTAAGCATYAAVEGDFGKSYQSAKNGQILNPAAGRNLAPVTGLSGIAAALVIGNYTASFIKSGEQSCAAGADAGGKSTYGK